MATLAFFFSDLISSAELFLPGFLFYQTLTNIPSSMTSTIFLSLSRLYLYLLLSSVSSCKQSFKIFCKISSHPEHVHTSLPPCWVLLYSLTLDYRGHNYFTTRTKLTQGYRTTVANTRFLQTGQPHVILYSNSHLSDDFY